MKKDLFFTTEEQAADFYREWQGDGVALWWLGQAGFLICYRGRKILIDAYLSDVLAEKYRGTDFPHIRMMDPPLPMESLTEIDYCISSHAHSDHMDPGLLPVLVRTSPSCRFIVPEAVLPIARERGVPEGRLIGINADTTLSLAADMSLSAIPAAHEELKQDERGGHFFLGYFLNLGKYRIYHPGDCLLYDGLDRWLEGPAIDLALMPVNGRKEELSKRGIAGNFSLGEAYQIMREHDITYLVPHHYGMFDFNTLPREELDAFIRKEWMQERILPAETGVMYHLFRT